MKYFFTQDKNGEKKLLSTRRITNKDVVTVKITNQGGDIEKFLSLSGKDCSGHISIWDLPGVTFGDPNEEVFFTINFDRFIMTLSETTDEYIKYRIEFYNADISDTTPVHTLTSLTCYHHDNGDTCDLLRDDEEIVATTLGGVPGIFVKISDDVEAITVAAGERINGLLSYSGLCVNGVYGHGQPFDKIVIEFLETNGNTYNKYRLTMTMGNVVVASIDVMNYERNAGSSDLPTSIEISGSSYEAAVFNLFNPEEPFVSSVRTKIGGKTYALGAVGDAVIWLCDNGSKISCMFEFKNEKLYKIANAPLFFADNIFLSEKDGVFIAENETGFLVSFDMRNWKRDDNYRKIYEYFLNSSKATYVDDFCINGIKNNRHGCLFYDVLTENFYYILVQGMRFSRVLVPTNWYEGGCGMFIFRMPKRLYVLNPEFRIENNVLANTNWEEVCRILEVDGKRIADYNLSVNVVSPSRFFVTNKIKN